MNVLINFRYLSGPGYIPEVVKEVAESDTVNELSNDLKHVTKSITQFITIDKLECDDKAISYVKETVRKTIDNRLSGFNNDYEKYSFLWLDEICVVSINGKKAIPLDDEKDYVNFEDVKETVQGAINRIASLNDNFDPSTYHDIMFVLYIDIIEKDAPLTMIFPEDLEK